MNKLGTKLGAVAMSAVMALSFAPSAAITSLAAGGDDLTDATQELSTPVYRLYNPNSGEHLFTVNENECDSLDKNGWDSEGIAWYAPSTGDPVYRLYNPNAPLGDHHYTASVEEKDNLVKLGWRLDATAFNTVAEGDLLGAPVYRLYNPNASALGQATHHLTLRKEEADGLALLGWNDEGPKFYEYAEDLDPEVEELTVSIDNTTPKVGDTLVATVVDRNGEDVSDAVSYQWYLDDEKLDGETDDTLDVTVGMIGSTIKVVATAENGNTFESDETEAVGVHTFDITSAEATKVNEITVNFADAVDSENVTFTVTKGTLSVPIEKVTEDDWTITEDEVTLTTSAKMTNGTYTVTATDGVTEAEDSIDFEVVGQYVKEIVILNDVAYTNVDANNAENSHKKAYAYYDVKDQYGESMRTSASIQWSGSCKITPNKTTGKLTLEKNDNPQTSWVFNDKIYITGVYTKTGVTASKELTVGTEQSLDTIEMKGFVKKGTTDIVDTLPADFKDGEYYLLFDALDQNECALDVDSVAARDVTFVSDNVLVVKELNTVDKRGLTIAGVEYNAVPVTPGIKVADGGEVTVTAIANKTGKKTDLNFVVGEDAVVVSFTISAPAKTIADGDTLVSIPFEALDANNNPIKNFRTLAKQKTFNTLTFNASEGSLALVEQNDGTAALMWSDSADYRNADSWKLSQTTDGIDRPVSLTVVVVGGATDNEMIYVSDKRRPDAIADIKADKVYTENSTVTFKNTHTNKAGEFKFYDQYGEIIGTTWGADNGFFAADAANDLKGIDFANHHFGVRAIYAGSGKMNFKNTTSLVAQDDAQKYTVLENGQYASYITSTDVLSVATNEGFKFEIVSIKDADYNAGATADKWDSVSTSKYIPMTVVDITQVKNFKLNDLGTVYVGKLDKTGDGVWEVADDLAKDNTYFTAIATAPTTDQQKTAKVTGSWNSETVTIPYEFLDFAADKLTITDADGTITAPVLAATETSKALRPSDLYDKTTAKGVSKLGEDTIKATIKKLYSVTDDQVYKTATTITYTDLAEGVTAATWAAWDKDTDPADITAAINTAATIAAGTEKTAAETKLTTANNNLKALKAKVVGIENVTEAQLAVVASITDTTNDVNALVNGAGLVLVDNSAVVYDTTSTSVKLSDQAPYAYAIKNLQEAYTLTPQYTYFDDAAGVDVDDNADTAVVTLTSELIDLINAKNAADGKDPVTVVDQYGFDYDPTPGSIKFKVTDTVESTEGYAENNLKVAGNDSDDIVVSGAERGDTFTLVVYFEKAQASTKITVGADAMAMIVNSINAYRDMLVPVLEVQRVAGLQ